MYSIRAMKKEDMDEVLEMMKVFYASPAVLHKAPEEILRQDIEDCVGDMPYIEGYVFVEETAGLAGETFSLSEETASLPEREHGQMEKDTAVKTEGIAGYAMVAKGYSTEYGGLCLWVEDLYMKPEYRHQGLGSLFFSYLEKQYEGQAVRFRLEVEEENRAAVEAYRKNGYQTLPYMEMTKEV